MNKVIPFGIGIVIIAIVVFGMSMDSDTKSSNFQNNNEHYTIEIVGLKNTYFVGESFDFSYVISGFGHSCGGKEVTFLMKTVN